MEFFKKSIPGLRYGHLKRDAKSLWKFVEGYPLPQLPQAQIRSKFKHFCTHQDELRWSCWVLKMSKISFGAKIMGILKKVVTKVFFFGVSSLFQTGAMTSNFDKIKKFKKPALKPRAQSFSWFWNFWKFGPRLWYFLTDFYTITYLVPNCGTFWRIFTRPYFSGLHCFHFHFFLLLPYK